MSMFRNVVASVIGTRIATDTKSAGLIGVVAGLAATRVMARSPLGALVVGGGYLAHKLLQKRYEIDAAKEAKTAVAAVPANSTLLPAPNETAQPTARAAAPGKAAATRPAPTRAVSPEPPRSGGN